MAFDEGLAQRVRELPDGNPHATQKKMFGGLIRTHFARHPLGSYNKEIDDLNDLSNFLYRIRHG